eukprot:TRINITY_DN65238_c0_g1_i1.p1 TRINITY_DN65238_c0_g1~~TRINITY_DN65238_c0_g1_i1.p1  ORF type:complete len:484 (+),score=169.53 TRINITY_DN65238_c0_g1_i1:88-1452(+)
MGVPRQVVWMYVVVFLDITGIAIVVPLIPAIARELDMSYTTYGLIASVYGVAQVLSNPVMGALSDVRGRKQVFLISIAGAAVSYGMFGLSSRLASVGLLTASRICVGLVKQTMTIATAFVTDYTEPQERTPALAYLHAVSNLAFIVGAATGGALSSALGSVERAGYVSVGVYAVAFVVCLLFVDDKGSSLGNKQVCPALAALGQSPDEYKNKEAPHPVPGGEAAAALQKGAPVLTTMRTEFKGLLRDMSGNLRVRQALIASFLNTFSLLITQTSFSIVTQKRFDLNVKQNSYLISYASLVNAAVLFFVTPRLEQWLKKRNLDGTAVFAFSALLAGVARVLEARASTMHLLMGCMFFSALGNSLFSVYLGAMFTRLYEAEIGAAQGLFGNVESFCRVVAPALSGVLLDSGGVRMPWTVAGALNIVLAAYAYAAFPAAPPPRPKRPPPRPAPAKSD